MKTLILTPNRNLQCGMYQLAKDLAKEFDGEVWTKGQKIPNEKLWEFKRVITLMYPMHKHGKYLKENHGLKWICYDQKIPPVTKTYFPNFFRLQAMRYINWRNNITMKGADEYWDVTEREQKPRWIEKHKDKLHKDATSKFYRDGYALYLGRRTDYKNFDWLQKTMQELNIPLLTPKNPLPDDDIWSLISNAKLLVTASLWEGYGRPVMEAQALGIPVVCYDVGAHKKHIKKGICVPVGDKEAFKNAVLKIWNG